MDGASQLMRAIKEEPEEKASESDSESATDEVEEVEVILQLARTS